MAILIYPRRLYLLVLSMLIFGGTTFGQKIDSIVRVKRINISVKNEQVIEILAKMKAKSGIFFTGGFDPKKTLSLNLQGVTVISVLQILHDSVGLKWEIGEDAIRISTDSNFTSQSKQRDAPVRQTTGIIRDEKGKPLYGVTIIISGTKQGTTTDLSGNFKLNIDTFPRQLEISFIGYEKQLSMLTTNTHIDILLKLASKDVKEVVVMPYYYGSKWNTAGTASKVILHEMAEPLNSNGLLSLHGQVAGLTVTQTTGLPGGAVETQIRGANSFTGRSSPLYIVAGVPSVMTSQTVNGLPSVAAQSVNGGISPFSSMILDGIESISVLKDADATAIYGSRGANGVFLLTPYYVKPGPMKMEVNIQHGVGAPAHKLNLLSTKQYREVRRESLRNDKATYGVDLEGANNAPDLTVWDSLKQTDWQHELIGKTTSMNNVVVAVTAGDALMQGRIAASYYRESTPFLNKLFYNRKGISGSFVYQSTNKIFKVETFSSLSTDENKLYVGTLEGIFTSPNAPAPLDDKGQPVWTAGFDNPIAQLMREYRIVMWNYTFSVIPKFRLYKSLHLKAILGANGLFTNENSKIPMASQSPLNPDNILGEASQARKRMSGYIAEPILEYTPFRIPGDFTLIAGASLQHTSNFSSSVTGKGYSDDKYLQRWDSAAELNKSIPERSMYKYGAIFGMLKYIWKTKYITNIGFRKDASSRFSQGNNVGRFWSLAEAWIFSEEDFMKQHFAFLNFGKLRGSIGLTGSDQVGDNQFDDIWSPTPNVNLYEGIGGIRQENPRNTDFTWEKCLKIETAINLEFLEGRIRSDFSYFQNRNSRQLIEYLMPGQTGYQSMIRNNPTKVRTAGLEIFLSVQLFKSPNASLSISANLNFLQNKLLTFDRLNQSLYYGTLFINEPTTAIYKLKSEGVNSDNGLYQFTDVDKNNKFDSKDYQKIGTTMPNVFGGIDISLKIKRWELRATADFRKQTGPSFLQAALLADIYPGSMANQPIEILDRWQKKGDKAKYPKLSTMKDGDVWGNRSQILASSEAYTSTSFVKIRDVYVCYNLSKNWLSHCGFEEGKLFFKGYNLFTFTKYKTGDPEIANILSLSTLRTFAVGAKITLAPNPKKKQKK